jgi:YfiH family protein
LRRYDREKIPFFCFEGFPKGKQVQHAVFSRQGGISPAPYNTLNLSLSVPDDDENVFANRSLAYATHGRSNDMLVHAHLVHGAEVAVVSRRDYGQYVGPVDGLVTDEPGCGLTMNYADCAPILLYDPDNQAIGLGHAGWQGVVKDLPGAMVRVMRREYGTDPAKLLAGVGPCIGSCCYEVGEPVISAVAGSFKEPGSLLLSPGGTGQASDRRYFDLPEANRRRLAAEGVRHIEMSDLCTACRIDLFFSHRAERGQTGRFGALLTL